MERRSRPLFSPLELARFWLRDYGSFAAAPASSSIVKAAGAPLGSRVRGPKTPPRDG